MEFLPGAFEHEWERRRAALLHEMQLGRVARVHWDEPRRGGVARLQDDRLDDFGPVRPRRGDRNRHGPARPGTRPVGRSMWTRFSALARGSQPAVVKLASYGSGARAAAMMNYTSRGGELAVENECGERLQGRHALAEQQGKVGASLRQSRGQPGPSCLPCHDCRRRAAERRRPRVQSPRDTAVRPWKSKIRLCCWAPFH